jgi:hypothetical protein
MTNIIRTLLCDFPPFFPHNKEEKSLFESECIQHKVYTKLRFPYLLINILSNNMMYTFFFFLLLVLYYILLFDRQTKEMDNVSKNWIGTFAVAQMI